MRKLVVILAEVDSGSPDSMTELWHEEFAGEIPPPSTGESILDCLETQVMEHGHSVMRAIFEERWRRLDTELAERFREEKQPENVEPKGFRDLKVVSRLGIFHLPRHLFWDKQKGEHIFPGNAALPEHYGQATTRGIQEWCCLLPQEVPFDTAKRLLNWVCHAEKTLSKTQFSNLVRAHGTLIRTAETTEVKRIQSQSKDEIKAMTPVLTPNQQARCPAAWPEELNAVVAEALRQNEVKAPKGVSPYDWERVLEARRMGASAGVDLRRLGPVLAPGEVLAVTDDVLVNGVEKKKRISIRTAYVRTPEGHRYLCGKAESLLLQLLCLLQVCAGASAKLTVIGDGARWIYSFVSEKLTSLLPTQHIIDWYHLAKKCRELCSMIGKNRVDRKKLLAQLLFRFWRGDPAGALNILEAYKSETNNLEKHQELVNWIETRIAFLPSYQQRRSQRQYIGSGQVEKANDLLVTRRQKNKSMHWEEETSFGLATLRTLLLNGGWDLYWGNGQVLPLAKTTEPI